MPQSHFAAPAFGAANLSNCEREQIHLAGSIQPHGALLSLRESDLTIVQASANAAAFLRSDLPLPGVSLRALGGDLWRRAAEVPDDPELIPYVVRCRLADPTRRLTALFHRAAGGELVVELEASASPSDPVAEVERALQTITDAGSLRRLCDEAARIFKDVSGYDRVMIYRFDEEGHGEVFAETKKPELEAFLGNRYPASDIPQIARRLYERNRVRILADVGYAPAELVPALSPLTGEPLDMSLCFLRSASPIHVQYLKNMGVTATLVVSLMVAGKLWGLISCHHYSPRFLPFEMRAVCELIGEAVATRIAALEQRMMEAIARDGEWRGALFDGARSALLPVGASGAALLFEDQVHSIGEAPSTEDLRALGAWLRPRLAEGYVYATSALAADAPEFAALTATAAGVAATRISGESDEMLIWLRRERVRTITWGGKPFKEPSDGDDPSELSPRRSFAQWHQVVEGTSDPWTPADLAAARLMGASVTAAIAQFRAVQIVVANEQLEQFSRRMRRSGQLVLMADAEGRLIEAPSAFQHRVGARAAALRRLDDLPALFLEPGDLASRLQEMQSDRRGIRCEVTLALADGSGLPVELRADVIAGLDERLFGFVLTLTDLGERRAAEAARRRFQQSLIQNRRRLTRPLETQADVSAEALIAQVIENAQLAALEVTDSADPSDMRTLLDGIRRSVERSAEVMAHLRGPGTERER